MMKHDSVFLLVLKITKKKSPFGRKKDLKNCSALRAGEISLEKNSALRADKFKLETILKSRFVLFSLLVARRRRNF